jgi:acyl carrier protein
LEALFGELKEKILKELQLEDLNPADIKEETPFFDGGLGLDSVDLLVLVALLAREYGVEILNRELGEKVFVNFRTLAEYVSENRR